MAEQAPSKTYDDQSGVTRQVYNLNAGDTSKPIKLNLMAGLVATVQVTDNSGATITVQGMLDDPAEAEAEWATLTTVTGASAVLTAVGLIEIASGAAHLRLSCDSGTARAVIRTAEAA